MSLTSLLRPYFVNKARRTEAWSRNTRQVQLRQLRFLLESAGSTEFGKAHEFAGILAADDVAKAYTDAVECVEYEDIRESVERMLRGERDVLWRGLTCNFAQSSGTSGGKSKYIPITDDSLRLNHYKGGTDSVAHYLNLCPESRLFDGKALILGGSFANEVTEKHRRAKVGDLSATLIDRINPLANIVRVPPKKIALMSDWTEKLPLMVEACRKANVTNISGVPSWMGVLLRQVLASEGAESLAQVWRNLEVFFHGGISFTPYRKEYERLTAGLGNMRYLENYNASEGFFAMQDDFSDPAMLLLIDGGIFYEFKPLDGGEPLPAWEVEAGRCYELLISACNGLWRYSPGDTVMVNSVDPVKITVAGRTRSYINAFGEELMEWNAEKGVAEACEASGASIANYTVAPLFATSKEKGRHQWIVEWNRKPVSMERFAEALDTALQSVNSDYQAKRGGDIFLAMPEIRSVPAGTFDKWLHTTGSGKLGGQRKIPRLSNDRRVADAVLGMIH